MTHKEVLERMEKELIDIGLVDLKHMAEIYDRIISVKREELNKAVLERELITKELIKRRKRQ